MSNPGKSRERLLIRQIEGDAWEVWTMGEKGSARLSQVCKEPDEAQFSVSSVLALPLRQAFSVPLWLATADTALMREMVFLQLERRGLATGHSAQESVFDYRILKSADSQTLVLAIALPGGLPDKLRLDVQKFEPSARTHLLPKDEFILWREGKRLVFVATQGSEVAYFETLADDAITDEVLRNLQCIRLQLESENVVKEVNGITLWGEFNSEEISLIAGATKLRIKNDKRPAPVLPDEWMDLMPLSVRQSHGIAKTKERKRSVMLALAGVYLLLLLFLGSRVGWYYFQCHQFEADLKSHAATVSQLEATAHRWDMLDEAINPETYPVEQLLRCSRVLPADGVRFTLFKTMGGKIFIQGEAKSAPAAFKFAEDLKQSKDLADYKWEMPQPRLLPNDNAEFQVQGVKR